MWIFTFGKRGFIQNTYVDMLPGSYVGVYVNQMEETLCKNMTFYINGGQAEFLFQFLRYEGTLQQVSDIVTYLRNSMNKSRLEFRYANNSVKANNIKFYSVQGINELDIAVNDVQDLSLNNFLAELGSCDRAGGVGSTFKVYPTKDISLRSLAITNLTINPEPCNPFGVYNTMTVTSVDRIAFTNVSLNHYSISVSGTKEAFLDSLTMSQSKSTFGGALAISNGRSISGQNIKIANSRAQFGGAVYLYKVVKTTFTNLQIF
jgi:hypothetical protein